MEQGPGLMESVAEVGESLDRAPQLLVEIEPWHRVFFRNLADSIWTRRPPQLELASRPGDFWPDVFVASAPPWGRFLESALSHVALAAAIWAVAAYWPRHPQTVASPRFHSSDVIYYAAAEYLPPLDTGRPQAQRARRGEPELAPQAIISVPPQADNLTQSIVAPPNLKLNHDLALPNVVAWPKTLLAVPIAVTEHSLANEKAPDLTVSAVAPPPEVKLASSRRQLQAPEPAVVEPAPLVDSTPIRRLGDLNIGRTEAVAPAPQLPVGAERTLANTPPALGNSGQAVVPPPPSVPGSRVAVSGGRLVALGIHPAAPSGPVAPPAGNRLGRFAATPEGRAGASGTPDIAPTSAPGAENTGEGIPGTASRGLPPGLHVGQGPGPAEHSAAGGSDNRIRGAETGDRAVMAKATPPEVGAPTARPLHEVSGLQPSDAEKEVFGDRKFYSLTLNVPNLNSAGGSWVIHFAELNHEEAKGDLSAPTATREADPAYPLELMKQNIHGTVTLYAVIRRDGSVTDVRVLRSVDDRLDEFAQEALARWHFRPATKNGNAVDLEAVVTIPFRPGRVKSSF
jgi:TonB family protein